MWNCVKFQGTQMKLDWSRAGATGQSQSLQGVMGPEKHKVFCLVLIFTCLAPYSQRLLVPALEAVKSPQESLQGRPTPLRGLQWAPVIPAKSQSQQHSKFKFKASLGCRRLSQKPKLNKCLPLSVLFVCLLFTCLYCLLFCHLRKPWNEMRGPRCPVRSPLPVGICDSWSVKPGFKRPSLAPQWIWGPPELHETRI